MMLLKYSNTWYCDGTDVISSSVMVLKQYLYCDGNGVLPGTLMVLKQIPGAVMVLKQYLY